MKKIIITADDLGLDIKINNGIKETYLSGILSSASLLMNAPQTKHGLEIANKLQGLEIGLHLSIVEGISMRNKESSITGRDRYFENQICLHKNWKSFLRLYLLGKINYTELYEEFELQFIEFRKHFKSIPFVNGTQHLHLLPKVWKILVELMTKYDVYSVRLPDLMPPRVNLLNQKYIYVIPFEFLGRMNKKSLKNNIKSTDYVVGLQFSGNFSEKKLLAVLKSLPDNSTTEIVMHPGYYCRDLEIKLPENYSNFNWELEKHALMSTEIKKYIEDNKIHLIKFMNL